MSEQPALPSTSTPMAIWHLTNRFNLLGILSSRIVGPREAHDKYYRDLLELTPGWVPLTTALPSPALVEVVASDAGSFPVLLEFSSGQVVDGRVRLVRAELLRSVAAIHFADEQSLREHRARVYDNVPTPDERLTVSPDLFATEDGVTESEVATAAVAPGEPVDWMWIDRWRGALAAMAIAAHDEHAVGLLEQALQVASPSHWLPAALDLTRTGCASMSADDALFGASISVLAATDVAVDWSPRRVVEAINASVADTPLPDGERAMVVRNLETVRKIVDNERDFTPFSNRPGGLDSAKALLLALLRPDPDRLAGWDRAETGASVEVQMAALALTGSIRGLARMSTSRRKQVMDDYTAALALTALARAEVGMPSLDRHDVDGRVELTIDDEVIVRGDAHRSLAETFLSLPEPLRGSAATAIANALGWKDAVFSVARFRSPITVRSVGRSVEVVSSLPPVVTTETDTEAFVARLAALGAEDGERAATALASAHADTAQIPTLSTRRRRKATPGQPVT